MTGAVLWNVVGWMLAAAGVSVIALGLLWDRSRGRKRCPSCWYDMRGAGGAGGGTKCPECGHGVKSERSLLRTRRWWRLVVVGVVLMLAAYPAGQFPLLRAGKWREAVPTWVIVYCWPLNVETWDGIGSDPMIDELYSRLRDPTRNVWAARTFAVDFVEAGAIGPTSPGSFTARCRLMFDCSEHWEVLGRDLLIDDEDWECFGPRSPIQEVARPTDRAWASRDCMMELQDLITTSVNPDDWRENGGDQAMVRQIGPVLVIEGPYHTANAAHDLLWRLVSYADKRRNVAQLPPVELCSDARLSTRAYDVRPLLPVALLETDRTNALNTLGDVMTAVVDTDNWYNTGGDTGMWRVNEGTGLLIIRHTPEVHAQIERYFKSIEGTRWWDTNSRDAAPTPPG